MNPNPGQVLPQAAFKAQPLWRSSADFLCDGLIDRSVHAFLSLSEKKHNNHSWGWHIVNVRSRLSTWTTTDDVWGSGGKISTLTPCYTDPRGKGGTWKQGGGWKQESGFSLSVSAAFKDLKKLLGKVKTTCAVNLAEIDALTLSQHHGENVSSVSNRGFSNHIFHHSLLLLGCI